MRILIVDDSKYQRFIIGQSLAGYGVCDQAADGVEAVAKVKEALDAGVPYALIVLDILMPGMDGHQALRTISALLQERGVPAGQRPRVIMLSSLDDPETMMQAQVDEGADYYITKPFEDKTLVEAMRSLELISNPLENEQDSDECDEC